MISFSMKMPYEMMQDIAKRARERRLELNLSQKTLSQKSGVRYGTLKKFESSGKISLESLLKLALVLGELESFEGVLLKHANALPASLDELLVDKSRKRGRK